ncbi:MAG TPA: plastocyanin/azurin family copper-binding protein [Candidatus Dormibacteraeota bacterium]|nr:plastocyanin/azurin family copper-binding protein [Candidatus Dormibacteraeota bacterium]
MTRSGRRPKQQRPRGLGVCPPSRTPRKSSNQANITIAHGSTVRWTNNGANMQHTVTSNGHAGANFACTPSSTEDFHSGLLAHGATFDHPFPTPGTFAYHCDFHGCTMAGTATVT